MDTLMETVEPEEAGLREDAELTTEIPAGHIVRTTIVPFQITPCDEVMHFPACENSPPSESEYPTCVPLESWSSIMEWDIKLSTPQSYIKAPGIKATEKEPGLHDPLFVPFVSCLHEMESCFTHALPMLPLSQ